MESPVVHPMADPAHVKLVQPPVSRIVAQVFPQQQEPKHEHGLLLGTESSDAAIIVHQLLGIEQAHREHFKQQTS